MTIVYQHEEWTLFRQIPTLCQKAGITPDRLQRTVLKELADNALDACGRCEVGRLPEGGFFVEDGGPGIQVDRLAELFSIRRPLTSSKLERMPTRGALGNGLRVVVGAVYASGGRLTVETRRRRMRLIPQDDGRTAVVEETSDRECGMRVEVVFGDTMPRDENPLGWAHRAAAMAGNSPIYTGKSSPHWEDADGFFERCQAAGATTARELISEFDGCSGRKAGEIAAEFKGRAAVSLTRDESAQLLKQAQENASIVKPNRLRAARACGVDLPGCSYAISTGAFDVEGTSRQPNAKDIPFTVEVWATPAERDIVEICVNRTPVVAEVGWTREADKWQIRIWGCELDCAVKVGRRPVRLLLNVQCPYVPITSDGKAPNLDFMWYEIKTTIEKAAKRNQRASRGCDTGRSSSQKDVVITHLAEAVEKTSGGGRYRYSQRQLFYAIRPFLLETFSKEPKYETFCRILTEYENDQGDLLGLYRDPRGIVYHPHLHEELPLGTIAVEKYRRPEWAFNKILYCEKEGFFPILRSVQWPEQFDCALLTSKGTATRAARDLLDLLGDSGEQITFFAIHDADAYGTNIYHALQAGTAARGARKVKIINLGLEPWEGIGMELPIESVERSKDRRPVAPYVREQPGKNWEEWLQTHRIELNAMTTPEFIAWLSRKMEEHGHHKVVPPAEVLADHLDRHLQEDVHKHIAERILSEHRADEVAREAIRQMQPARDELAKQLRKDVGSELQKNPVDWWRDPVARFAGALIRDHRNLL